MAKGSGDRHESMAAVQQTHGKAVDQSTYLDDTFSVASFVDLDCDFCTTDGRAAGKKDFVRERWIRATHRPRKVTRKRPEFPKS